MFAPGKAWNGNASGSAYGSRQRVARLLDTLAENEAANLFRLIMDAAAGGDTTAMRIVADRIWPPRKGRPVRLDFLPEMNPFESLGVVVKGLAEGVISPEEAANVATTLLAQARLQAARNEPGPSGSRVVVYLPDNGRGDTVGPDAGYRSPDPPPQERPQEAAECPEAVARHLHTSETLDPSQRRSDDGQPEGRVADPGSRSRPETPDALRDCHVNCTEDETAPPVTSPIKPLKPLMSDHARWRALAT